VNSYDHRHRQRRWTRWSDTQNPEKTRRQNYFVSFRDFFRAVLGGETGCFARDFFPERGEAKQKAQADLRLRSPFDDVTFHQSDAVSGR
jgi:hypothetical protein